MTTAAAKRYARSAIRRARPGAGKPKVNCTRKSAKRFSCRATWSTAGKTRRATLTVWYDADGDDVSWRYRGRIR